MPGSSPTKETASIKTVIVVNVVVFILFLLTAEGVAKLWLERSTGVSFPFLVNRSDPYEPPIRNSPHIPTGFLDPHLGYAHDTDRAKEMSEQYIPGFQVYGDLHSETALRIVALGGSTTDPFGFSDASWPELLKTGLENRGIEVCVLNGGVAGYSSNQELLKLMRDGLLVKPDIVISLNGVNDMGFVHSKSGHPLVHRFQERLFDQLAAPRIPALLPNLISVIRAQIFSTVRDGSKTITGVFYGLPNEASPAENWKENIVTMNGIADAHNVQFLNVLQPIGGFGLYTLSPKEEEDLRAKGERYLSEMLSFFEDARAKVGELPFCIDLTDVFAESQEVYTGDMRHQNLKGRRIIADAIVSEIARRGMLPSAATKRNSRSVESENR